MQAYQQNCMCPPLVEKCIVDDNLKLQKSQKFSSVAIYIVNFCWDISVKDMEQVEFLGSMKFITYFIVTYFLILKWFFLRCDMESDIFGWIDLVSYYQGRRIKAGFRDKKCQTKTQNFVFIKTLIVWKEKLKSFYGVSWECFARELFKNKA